MNIDQELIEKVKNKKLAEPELGEQCWFYNETDLNEIIALIRQQIGREYDYRVPQSAMCAGEILLTPEQAYMQGIKDATEIVHKVCKMEARND